MKTTLPSSTRRLAPMLCALLVTGAGAGTGTETPGPEAMDAARTESIVSAPAAATERVGSRAARIEGAPAAERLVATLEGLDLLSARFTQRIADERGTVLREAEGRLWASRPDRFRWEIERPFAELLVGDGTTLYLWDPDLEQVTIRPYDERLAGTPARLLSGSADELIADFDVSVVDRSGDRIVYELRPRTGEGLFASMQMAFVNGAPRVLTVLDSLGQRTEVRLDDVQIGGVPEPGRFTFEIPDGADVLREDGVYAAEDG